MLFIHYLSELRYRLFYCFTFFILNFIICLNFSKESLFFIVKPLLFINGSEHFSYFIFTNMSDVLVLYFKISFIFGCVFSLPYFFLQFWFFLVQGLYNYEKKNLLIFFFGLFSIYIIVSIFLYKYLIPFIWIFLLNFELNSSNFLFGVYYEARIDDYVNFMFYIFFIFSIVIQVPFFMGFLLYSNLLSTGFFIKGRKYFFLFFFIIGGFFTPPDLLSQLVISSFLIFLYEIILFFGILSNIYLNETN